METISELVNQLFSAKKAEAEAKEKRIAIEEAIASRVETPEDGSKTVPLEDGVKVTVKRTLLYKADIEAIRAMELPNPPLKMVPAKYELDKKLYEAIKDDTPELQGLVVVTPGKPSVTIKM